MLFASAIDVLSGVHWSRDNLMLAGFPFITAIGGLFVPAPTLKAMPALVQPILAQPLILGTVLLVVLKLMFGLRRG